MVSRRVQPVAFYVAPIDAFMWPIAYSNFLVMY